MNSKLLYSAAIATSLFSTSAFADDAGVFAGLDVTGGMASGSSDTRDGGAPNAGGVVHNVKFGDTVGIGGHIGYRFSPALSVFLSYRHIQGDVSWDADFPLYGVASSFDGRATSNAVLANVAYDTALSDTTSVTIDAGAGLSFNTLSKVVETDKPSDAFLADVENHTHMSPTVRLGAGIRHELSSNVALGLNASVSYSGDFKTGDTRSGNLGVTPITPYEIDDVYRASLGASIRYAF